MEIVVATAFQPRAYDTYGPVRPDSSGRQVESEPDPPEDLQGEIPDPFLICFPEEVITAEPPDDDDDDIPTRPDIPSSFPPPAPKKGRGGIGLVIAAAIAGALATIVSKLEGCF